MPLQMPSPGVEVLDSLLNESFSRDREQTVLEKGITTPEANKAPDNSRSDAQIQERMLITELGELISSGVYELDAILLKIAEASRKLTGASGSAIAMWKDGAVVCRASSGEGAPPLGAHLSVESGISGHCLRSGLAQHCGETETDPRVDAELCRQLGLRSVAVLPIRGWRGVNGILEVFSTEPRAFREQHFEVLEALAGLAERARASHAVPDSGKVAAAVAEKLDQLSPLLPASDRFRDLAAILLGAKKRTVVLATVLVIGLLLIAIVIWLGWRNPDSVKAKSNTSTPAASRVQTVSFKSQNPVWQPNPGGESLFFSPAPTGSGRVAAKSITSRQAGQEHARQTPAGSDGGASEVVKHYETTEQPKPADSSAEAPPVVTAALNPTVLDNLLSVPKPEPKLSAVRMSQGISNGYLIRHIAPIYPQQARLTRIEGDVVLNALIADDGTVHDVKVMSGQPTLARAALDAVRQWRYKPYQLNGKPVNMNTTITVSFKLP